MNAVRTSDLATRSALVIDGGVFAAAALFNFGVRLPIGLTTLEFPQPVWQAGVGEALIGLSLLTAGLTGRVGLGWAALALSIAGIAFGLSSPRVVGPAHDIHVLLVPLAIAVAGLMSVRWWVARRSGSPEPEPANAASAGGPVQGRRRPIMVGVVVLLAVEAVAFALVSLIHFHLVAFAIGPIVVDDPFPGAAWPEGIIAAILAAAAAALAARATSGWAMALGASLFATALTAFGLTITVAAGRSGDVVFHVSILAALVVTVALLVAPGTRRLVSSA